MLKTQTKALQVTFIIQYTQTKAVQVISIHSIYANKSTSNNFYQYNIHRQKHLSNFHLDNMS